MATSLTVAIVTLDGFNEIDTFVATRMLDSVPGIDVRLAGSDERATSAAGVVVDTPMSATPTPSSSAVASGPSNTSRTSRSWPRSTPA